MPLSEPIRMGCPRAEGGAILLQAQVVLHGWGLEWMLGAAGSWTKAFGLRSVCPRKHGMNQWQGGFFTFGVGAELWRWDREIIEFSRIRGKEDTAWPVVALLDH